MKSNMRECPVCKRKNSTKIYKRKLINFDGFSSFENVTISKCKYCGLLYNDIIYEKELTDFYILENPYSSQSSFGTGGLGEGDIKRYDFYIDILQQYLPLDATICDVGCAKGGSVKYISRIFSNIMGIELDQKLVDIANSENIKVLKTELYDYPLDDNSVDCLIYTHVFEHILDFSKVFKEIKRVLKPEGMLFIEVPNVSGYYKNRVFDFYWFYIREHINHFNQISLKNLLLLNNFKNLTILEQSISYNNKLHSYPSLIGLFKNNSKNDTNIEFSVDKIEEYISQENTKVIKHCETINDLIHKYDEIYFWGIGQEFFTLASHLNLDLIKNSFFIDNNTAKQEKSIFGNSIYSSNILKNKIPNKTFVVICSAFNSQSIESALKNINPDIEYYIVS